MQAYGNNGYRWRFLNGGKKWRCVKLSKPSTSGTGMNQELEQVAFNVLNIAPADSLMFYEPTKKA